ncbi:hypothetical protein PP301_gp015 [Gordonia phage GMA2]|uniref:Uncharacterized protein n=1 Tax=Gordonia phage GMA2 TaxID=1647283 RepID=A0A0K0N725_9CAUD|nr:hypothetical protein PP301_gp015 [Gordonia phage GMA2]AKJ72553.1 hypothetical protein GMA2_15 [Gordonia phage GMA2]
MSSVDRFVLKPGDLVEVKDGKTAEKKKSLPKKTTSKKPLSKSK